MIGLIIYHLIIGIPFAKYEDQMIKEDNRRDFLTSILQATASMVGIVFAISIVIVEHSASNYSPRILELLKKDLVFSFTLSFGLFTIGFISMTILNNWQTVLASSSLFLWNLVLLGIYLWYILHKINPLSIMKEVVSDITSQIDKIKKELPKHEKTYVNNDTTKTVKLVYAQNPEIIRSIVLKNNYELMHEILDDENTLQHIILDSFKKEEYQTSSRGLDNYNTILEKYLEIIPNYQWMNDQFIENIISKFENFASKGIEKKDTIFLRQVIASFGKLGLSLTKISELQHSMEPPWPVTRQINSLSNIGKQSIANVIWDGALDSITNLGNIGISAIQKYRKDGYASYNITDLGNQAVSLRESITASHASYHILKLIQYMIAYKSNNTRIRMTIEDLKKLLVNFQNVKMQTLRLTPLFFNTLNEISIRSCAEQGFALLNEEFPQIETKWREDLEKDVISSLIELLGEVGIANKNHDLIITKYCAESLTSIAARCLEQTFHTVKDGHRNELEDIIRFLHRMHYYDFERNSLYSREIPLRLAEMGIICMDKDTDDLTNKCIQTISTIAHQSLKTDEYGYESTRMVRQLNLVGCAAIELNKSEILDSVIESIAEFDKEYIEKFDILPRVELHLEQTEWEVDPFEDQSRIFNMVKIMKMDNRIELEHKVTQKRLEKLKKKTK